MPRGESSAGEPQPTFSGRSRSKFGAGGNGDMSSDGADFLVKLITHAIDAFWYAFCFHLTLDLGHLPLKLNVF